MVIPKLMHWSLVQSQQYTCIFFRLTQPCLAPTLSAPNVVVVTLVSVMMTLGALRVNSGEAMTSTLCSFSFFLCGVKSKEAVEPGVTSKPMAWSLPSNSEKRRNLWNSNIQLSLLVCDIYLFIIWRNTWKQGQYHQWSWQCLLMPWASFHKGFMSP